MINNLQALRAFAAINVALHHIAEVASSYLQPTIVLSIFKGWGANGVDIFFVISGFIILYSQYIRKKNIADFLLSRIVRVAPLYWLLSSLIIIGFFIYPSAFRNFEVTPSLVFSSYFFSSKLFGAAYPVINVGWTLELEMMFYFVFGISLLFKRLNHSIFFTTIIIICIALISKSYILFEFIGGLIIAFIYHQKIISRKVGNLILIAGCILLILSATNIVKSLEVDRLFIWGCPSLLIVLGTVSSEQSTSKFLTHLGNASYSIYLVHYSIVSIFYKLITFFQVQLNSDFLALMCLLISVAAGSFTYIFIERPLIKCLRGRLNRH